MKPLPSTPMSVGIAAVLDGTAGCPDHAATLRAVKLYCEVELARLGLAQPTGAGSGLAAEVVRELPEAALRAAGRIC